MKMRIITLITLITFSLTSFTVKAQDTKLGHVNIASLLVVMPSYKSAEIELKNYAKQLEANLAGMQQEYQQKVAKYYEEEASMIPAIMETRQSEIVDLEKRIQTVQAKSESQLTARQEELLLPIEAEVVAAIKNFAQQNGYKYIFDSSKGSALLYAPEADDVTDQLKGALGIQ